MGRNWNVFKFLKIKFEGVDTSYKMGGDSHGQGESQRAVGTDDQNPDLPCPGGGRGSVPGWDRPRSARREFL